MILTFSVIRQVRYFLSSPINITLLRKGTSLLMQSLMYTGGTFSPPAVMISSISHHINYTGIIYIHLLPLMRPVMYKKPSYIEYTINTTNIHNTQLALSKRPISPECNHPSSSIVSFVFSSMPR